MKKVSEYRQHARECRVLAARMGQEENREQLLAMAAPWDLLAEERARVLGMEERQTFTSGSPGLTSTEM